MKHFCCSHAFELCVLTTELYLIQLYTTLSPCSMCSGAALLFKIPRIVLGENETFVGAEKWLESNGVEVVNVHNKECKNLMDRFIKEKPEVWNEDIGE